MQIEARGRTRRDRLSTLKWCLSSSYALPRHYILITYFINTKYALQQGASIDGSRARTGIRVKMILKLSTSNFCRLQSEIT